MSAEPTKGSIAAGKTIGTTASATQSTTSSVARRRNESGWASGIRRGTLATRLPPVQWRSERPPGNLARRGRREYVSPMADGRLWIEGAWVDGDHQAEVRAPWDGRLLRRVAQASAAQADQALSVALAARERLQRQSTGKRREVLEGIVAGLRGRARGDRASHLPRGREAASPWRGWRCGGPSRCSGWRPRSSAASAAPSSRWTWTPAPRAWRPRSAAFPPGWWWGSSPSTSRSTSGRTRSPRRWRWARQSSSSRRPRRRPRSCSWPSSRRRRAPTRPPSRSSPATTRSPSGWRPTRGCGSSPSPGARRWAGR